jgi:hypothetical protein
MKRKILRWMLPVLMFISVLFVPVFALAEKVDIDLEQLEEITGLEFNPMDMNDYYISGTTSVSDKVWFLERATGNQYNLGLELYTFVKNIKVVDHSIVFLTYESAGYSSSNFKVVKYDIASDSSQKLLDSKESITLRAATEKGFIYTVDSIIKGNDLWYFDFSTGKKTKIATNIGSAHMSDDLIVYSLASSNLLDSNEEINYVYTDDLGQKYKVPYKGTEVKTNGQYIAFWYYNSYSSTDRYVAVHDPSSNQTYTFSEYAEGKATNQDLVFGGDSYMIWNSDNWQNKKYAIHVYDLKNDIQYNIEKSLMPIAATSKEAIFSAATSYTTYYLPLKEVPDEEKEAADKYYEKGYALFLDKQYQESIQYFDEAISLNNDNYKYYYYKALSLHYLGKYDQSLSAFNRSIALLEKINKLPSITKDIIYKNVETLEKLNVVNDTSVNILSGEIATEGLKDVNGTIYDNGFYVGYYYAGTSDYEVGTLSKEYSLDRKYGKFEATLVPSYYFSSYNIQESNIGRLKVYGDGKLLYDSGTISSTKITPVNISVNLEGISNVKIEVLDGISIGFFNPKFYSN